jgi:hypothetical protein
LFPLGVRAASQIGRVRSAGRSNAFIRSSHHGSREGAALGHRRSDDALTGGTERSKHGRSGYRLPLFNQIDESAAGFWGASFSMEPCSVGLTPEIRALVALFLAQERGTSRKRPWVQNTSCNRRPQGFIPEGEGRQVGALWLVSHREDTRCAATRRKTGRSSSTNSAGFGRRSPSRPLHCAIPRSAALRSPRMRRI